jgi:hypothetical protein
MSLAQNLPSVVVELKHAMHGGTAFHELETSLKD